MLKVILESPKRFKAQYIDKKIEPKETKALSFGSAIHLALLEPQKFNARYRVEPQLRRNTNAYKDWREETLLNQPDAVIMSHDEWDQLTGMASSILSHSEASAMLRKGVPEQSIYGTMALRDPAFSYGDSQDPPPVMMPVKARPDWLHENGDIIDYKTARDAGFQPFRRQLYDLQYHLSMAWYRHVVNLEYGDSDRHCWWIVQEKECPWDVCVYRANDMVLDRGEADFYRAIWRYKTCLETGVWPGKQERAQDIDLPGYAQYE